MPAACRWTQFARLGTLQLNAEHVCCLNGAIEKTKVLEIFERLGELGISVPLLIGAVAGALALLVGIAVIRALRRRRPAELPRPDLSIDIRTLGDDGPPERGAKLEVYHLPMRLAALVLAPTGRGGTLPPQEQIPTIIDHIVPNLGEVFREHQSVLRLWPSQLSSEGFANTFFTNARLPGQGGKGTPWCAVAGRFEAEGQKYLVGMLLCAAAPNSLSQLTVQRDTQWLDLLRVRT